MLMDGIFAAVTTPFYPDERVYYHKLEANMARYSRSRMAGIVLLGSTGEAVMLDDAESCQVLRVASEATASEMVLVAGVARESVKSTVALAEAAATFHYDAILVRTPSYFAPQMSSAAVLHYFRSVADRSPLPLILYNIPQFVPYTIPVDLVAELAAHPNIVGIKDSSGDLERMGTLVAATRSEASFQVLTGAGSVTLDSLESGATGAILGSAAFAPEACTEIYLAWKARDRSLARQKQDRIVAADRRITGQLGVSGVKYACDFNGYYGGPPRSPLASLTSEAKAEVEKLLATIRD